MSNDHHRSRHRRGKKSESSSKTIRQIYWKVFLCYLLFAILGLFVCLICTNKPIVREISFSKHGFMSGAILSIFKYFLNFPLGMANYFSDTFLASTYLFFIPDSFVVTWVLLKIFPQHTRIDKVLNIVVISWFGSTILLLVLSYLNL